MFNEIGIDLRPFKSITVQIGATKERVIINGSKYINDEIISNELLIKATPEQLRSIAKQLLAVLPEETQETTKQESEVSAA